MVRVRGAFLSATIQNLLAKLSSTDFIDYINYSNLDLLYLAVFETTLRTLHAVLDDAENNQFFNSELQQWLEKLELPISTAEDLLDDIGYDLLKCKIENSQPDCYYENLQLKLLCENLRCYAEKIDELGLQRSVNVSSRVYVSNRMPSNEFAIVGRNDDKERLMNMLLLGSNDNDNNLGVVAILGLGGVGKTTLAQLVYKDEQVKQHFDLKVWVSVLEDFDILRITLAILALVSNLLGRKYEFMVKDYKSCDLDYLKIQLKQELGGKRFLIVLDDLFSDSYNDWHEIVSPLTNGKSGSRVIITTRREKVAEVTHTFPIHRLEPLSDEDCWYLLSKHAFGSEDFCCNEYTNLEAIGRKIVRKCGGLPIIAKTLGGLLRSKVDAKEWTAILNSNTWNLPMDNVVPALLLSYQYLPSHLKRCFAYCSIFQKGYPLDRKLLVLLWMAEGFLEHSQGEKTPEEVGDDYFGELLSRSLIQQSNGDVGREKFVMHDLVNDLVTIVSGKSSCRLESGGSISKNVHHLSYNQEGYDIFKKFEIVYDFECLRGFLPIVLQQGPSCYLSTKVVDDLLPTLIRLRVLSLSKYINITELPNKIYILKQLRYLDLSYTGIKILPNTICDLYYLETLILSTCWSLTELPVDIGKLINLRHLDISYTHIKEMPMQIVGLANLQTLTVFVVGNQEVGLGVRELGKFPNLRGKLCIQNLHNVIDVSEACSANLKSKEHIEELELEWDKPAEWDEPTEDSLSKEVLLDVLQPSVSLTKLEIGLYGGTHFPSWLGDSSFSNMVYLCLSFCEYCVTLPPLGKLPSLKDLQINFIERLETIGQEFYGTVGGGSNFSFQPFPSLEYLTFSYMSNWKEWLPYGGGKSPFPRLKTLKLDHCPELRGRLPYHLSSIERIEIDCCDRLLATRPTLHWLSLVKYLYLHSQGCTEWSLFDSDSPSLLQHVSIRNFSSMLSLPRMILSATCLQHLELYYIDSLTAFPVNGLPTSLQSLCIHDSGNLTFLPTETWSNYTSLVTLKLDNCCDALTSFPLDAFPVLQRLSIYRCSSLESIFISENISLGPSTLQSLEVSHCNALKSLPQRMDTLTALERLMLNSLPSCCEGAYLPPALRLIDIESLGKTTNVTEWGLQNLTALSGLHIGGDDVVNTLLKEQLLPTSLVSLTINNLSEMKFIEEKGLQHLSFLENLTFKSWSALESLLEGTLPSFLKSLKFRYCPKLQSLPDMLPSSLETLVIEDCKRLETLPDRLPSSLETLEIEGCKRLQALPNNGLPSSLKLLSIERCRLLRARYDSQKGEYWSKIAHIPVIKIDGKLTI